MGWSCSEMMSSLYDLNPESLYLYLQFGVKVTAWQ
jgi:hypothetical protein